MDKTKHYKIALVVRTSGLEYDDRIRKEVLTIQNLFPNVKFKIFPMLFDKNCEEEGISSYGVPYKSVYSPVRKKYKSGTHLLAKSIDFYRSIKKDLKQFDAIWCADIETFIFVILNSTKPLIWDLHELPSMLLGSPLKRMLLKCLFRKCRCVVHANPQRFGYLKTCGVIADPKKHFALRNYPNFEDVDEEYDSLYYSFLEWRGGRKCIYLQGLNDDSRAPYESVKAVLTIPELVAVVVGGFDDISREKLQKEFGPVLSSRVFFVGKVAQMKIPQYVKQCVASIILYKNTCPNNWFCEANRFYQSVIMGLPVVVGNNPSMKELVDKFGFGVSIDDDGGDVDKIKKGVEEVLEKYGKYRDNNMAFGKNLLWKTQNGLIEDIIEKWLY